MTEIATVYKGDLKCCSKHPSGAELTTDAPVDNQGKGESFSPTDLFVISISSCMATIMGIQANALSIDLAGMTMKTKKTMSAERPRRVARVDIDFYIPCDPEEKRKQQLIRAAESCPVKHSLSPEVEVNVLYNWGSA